MAALKTLVCLVFLYQTLGSEAAYNASFPIGGLFNKHSLSSSREAFENIVKVHTSGYHGRVFYSNVVDSYSTALEVCPYTSNNKGIVALIDARPTNGICDTVCMLCNRLNITHLSLGWQLPDTLATDIFTFSYYPPAELISKAYATLIRKMQWDKFTIFYEDDDSFIRLQELINTWPTNYEPIIFRKLDPEGDNREIFKHIFKVAHMSYHVLDCKVNNIRKYIKEIIKVENSTLYQSFILTALDAYTVNFQDIPEFMANVSTLHLTMSNDVRWKDVGIQIDSDVQLETALAADALNHLDKALSYMNDPTKRSQERFTNPPALCFSDSKIEYEELAWPSGTDLRDGLIKTTLKGFTGSVEFDEEGKRTNFTLYYSKLNNESYFNYAGQWSSKTDYIYEEATVSDRSQTSRSLLKIVSKKADPYFYVEEYENGTLGYRGYAVELIDEIFREIYTNHKIDLKYEFVTAPGDITGNPIEGTKNKKWNGIIGELIDHKADMGISDLTITSERNEVVDFSTPFMSLGIGMLFKEPDPEVPDMFSFMNPLDLDVWLYLATTYIIVSFVLFICARMSQNDWVNPHPCNQNPANLQNIWSLYNCMWLTIGAIMTQGCDILPRSAGSRWIAGMWWFFALILTASYQANMSTFISNSRRSNDIKNVKDLSEQNAVSYGTLYNGSTFKFFQNSNDSVYQKIWTVMQSAKPKVFTNTNEEGKNRVLKSKGKYAFFMESSTIEYYLERNCDLKMVGSKLDSKEYGIAMPKNFPHKGLVDNAILTLQESGKLQLIKKKWWEEENNEVKCEDSEKLQDDSGSLQMKNTSGIFLVLGMGGILGVIVAIIDFLLHARKISVKEKITFREAILSEWRSSLNPRTLHKPVAPSRSAAPSTESPSPLRERSQSRAVSVLRAATSFINFDEIY